MKENDGLMVVLGKQGHWILMLASIPVPIKTAIYRNQWVPEWKGMLHEPCTLVSAFHLITGGMGFGKKIKGEEKLLSELKWDPEDLDVT